MAFKKEENEFNILEEDAEEEELDLTQVDELLNAVN